MRTAPRPHTPQDPAEHKHKSAEDGQAEPGQTQERQTVESRAEESQLEHRHRERELAEVERQGPTRVAELLLAAMRGDPGSAALPIGPVLRALPGVGWLTARDMLLRAGVPREDTALGSIDGPQRAVLAAELAQIPVRREER